MSFNFFTIRQQANNTFKTSTAYYPVAVPTTGGAIDVYGNFRWKNTGDLEEVPQILLTEYKLNTGARTSNLLQIWGEMVGKVINNTSSVSSLINSAGNGVKEALVKSMFGDPYEGLYKGEPTGFYYNLPYIKNGVIRGDSTKNTWGKNDGTLIDILARTFSNVSGLANTLGASVAGLTDQGYGAELIKKYEDTTPRSVTISFNLYNTYSTREANDNFSFISLFNFQNLKTRTTYTTFLPPKVYSVDTLDEGGIYMPIAFVSDFKVENLGTLRRMKDFGTSMTGLESASGYRLVPEAYKISITLQELIPESTNIMQGVLGGNKVQVITAPIDAGSINLGESGGGGMFDFGADSGSSAGTTGDFYQIDSSFAEDLTSDSAISSIGFTAQDKLNLENYQTDIQNEAALTDLNNLTSAGLSDQDKQNLENYQNELALSSDSAISSTGLESGAGKSTDQYQLPGMIDSPPSTPVQQLPGMGGNEEPVMNDQPPVPGSLNNPYYIPGMSSESLPENNVNILSQPLTQVDKENVDMSLAYLYGQQQIALQEYQQTGDPNALQQYVLQREAYNSMTKAVQETNFNPTQLPEHQYTNIPEETNKDVVPSPNIALEINKPSVEAYNSIDHQKIVSDRLISSEVQMTPQQLSTIAATPDNFLTEQVNAIENAGLKINFIKESSQKGVYTPVYQNSDGSYTPLSVDTFIGNKTVGEVVAEDYKTKHPAENTQPFAGNNKQLPSVYPGLTYSTDKEGNIIDVIRG